MSRFAFAAFPLAAFALGACTPTAGPLAPAPSSAEVLSELSLLDLDADVVGARGLNIDPRTGDFVFITDRGLLHVDIAGNETLRHDIDSVFVETGRDPETGESYGWDSNISVFGDVASLGDGTYALPMENMVRRYDPATGIAEDFFCLEPGFEFQVMHNDAISLNLADNEILAAPMITENGEVVANNLVSYDATDAQLASAESIVDSNFHPEGIAFHARTNRVIAVEGNQAAAFDRAGKMLVSAQLDGIESAVGATIDNDTDTLYVLDGTSLTMRAFSLKGLGE